MGSGAQGVAFRVLGPLEVVVDGRVVALGSPKVRLLLAALLVDANSVVSTDRLVEALWGDRPPATALSALQKLVHRLRSLVRSTHPLDVLVTRAPGYVLRVERECYDAAQFEELVVDAQRRAQRGDADVALATLDEALALWRGPALAEFASEEFARAEAARLEELRVVAVEERVEAKLRLGRHDEVTGELDALVAEFPYREGLWGQLMIALYRSGRQADALRAYSQVRTQLAEALGIDPGAPLRNLEQAILMQKPELDWVPPPSSAAAVLAIEGPAGMRRDAWRPALPMALARDEVLVGLHVETAWLDDLLARAEHAPLAALVRGKRGSGRTTLAVSFGRRAFQQGCAVMYGAATSRLSRLQPLLDAVAVIESLDGSCDEDVDGFAAELRDVVCRVGRSTSRPVVLIVDNVDQAGPETVEVLERLLASPEAGGLLVIATTAAASEGDASSERWWTEECTLTPFTDREVATVLEHRLGRAPPPELSAAVREETDGNPRRVDELAARLAEAEVDLRVERAVARAEVAQRDLRTVHGEITTSISERGQRGTLTRRDDAPPEAAGSVACPYKGLAYFEAADAGFFCGRDRLVDELVARLAVSRLVAVVGPSGSGKSSLLRAGLLPALEAGALPGSRDWDTVLVTPGDQPRLEHALAGRHRRVTVVVDHLEELFTAGLDDDAQTAFLDAMVQAATTPDGSTTVVVAFRADYYGRFAVYPEFAARARRESPAGRTHDRRRGPRRDRGTRPPRGTDARNRACRRDRRRRGGPAGRAPVVVDGTAGDLGAPPRPHPHPRRLPRRRRCGRRGGPPRRGHLPAVDTGRAARVPAAPAATRRARGRLRRRPPAGAARRARRHARAPDARRTASRHHERRRGRGRARGVAARVAPPAKLVGGGPRRSPAPPPRRGRGDRLGHLWARSHRAVPRHAPRRRARLVRNPSQ